MHEHRCGIMHCPICIAERTFIAVVIDGVARGYDGRKVRHIADAFCRTCGFTYGRGDMRDDVTGHVRRDMPLVSDAAAAAAARRLGVPLEAALFGDAARFAETEAAASAAATAETREETPLDDLDSFLQQLG